MAADIFTILIVKYLYSVITAVDCLLSPVDAVLDADGNPIESDCVLV